MTTEEKIIAKVRKILLADSTIRGYVGTRVYEDHPSTISEPVFPCISLFAGPSKPIYYAPSVVVMRLQIDIWFKETATNDDLRLCHDCIPADLHRVSINDTAINVKGSAIELEAGQIMFEQDTRLRHLPIRFEVRGM
jgi:hypothetical protein